MPLRKRARWLTRKKSRWGIEGGDRRLPSQRLLTPSRCSTEGVEMALAAGARQSLAAKSHRAGGSLLQPEISLPEGGGGGRGDSSSGAGMRQRDSPLERLFLRFRDVIAKTPLRTSMGIFWGGVGGGNFLSLPLLTSLSRNALALVLIHTRVRTEGPTERRRRSDGVVVMMMHEGLRVGPTPRRPRDGGAGHTHVRRPDDQ